MQYEFHDHLHTTCIFMDLLIYKKIDCGMWINPTVNQPYLTPTNYMTFPISIPPFVYFQPHCR